MRPILDCRETVIELCRPAAAHSRREYGRAMAQRRGQFCDLGYPVTKMLAHMLARAVDAADFRLSRNGDGAVPAAAYSLRACRESDGATARAGLLTLGIRSLRC